jgi:hypothetical protein
MNEIEDNKVRCKCSFMGWIIDSSLTTWEFPISLRRAVDKDFMCALQMGMMKVRKAATARQNIKIPVNTPEKKGLSSYASSALIPVFLKPTLPCNQ